MAGKMAFDEAECMFFVGGDDFKANNDGAGGDDGVAGGCTKEWWLAQLGGLEVGDAGYEAAAISAMGKLMTTGGLPIVNEGTFFVNDYHAGEYWVKFLGVAGDFDGVEAGMLAYIDDEDNTFEEGSGVYKIIEVAGDTSWIKVEVEIVFEEVAGHECDLYIGGAWEEIDVLAEEISASAYTQEIHCNKEFITPEVWDWDNWGYGDAFKNTWLKVLGFNRVPWDIVNIRGNYHQSIADAKSNGVTATSWVELDLNDMDQTFIEPEGTENLRISGFHFTGQNTDEHILYSNDASDWKNIEISHNAFQLSYHGFNLTGGSSLFFYDNYFYTDIALDSKYVLVFAPGVSAYIKNNVFDFDELKIVFLQFASDAVFVSGNLGMGNWVNTNIGAGNFVVQERNTWLNTGNGVSAIRTDNGTTISVENIIMPKTEDQTAFQITANGGSVISKRDCIYSEDDDELTNIMENLYAGGRATSNENTVEEDPQFAGAGNLRPQNKNVLLGGAVDSGGVRRHIGCVGQQWQFDGRSRIGNVGRLGIFR